MISGSFISTNSDLERTAFIKSPFLMALTTSLIGSTITILVPGCSNGFNTPLVASIKAFLAKSPSGGNIAEHLPDRRLSGPAAPKRGQ